MKRQIGKRLLLEILLHRRNSTGEISVLLVEHERHDAISRMPSLASGLINEYTQLPSDEKPPIYKKCRGTPPATW